jgi:hypothetical protein
MNCNLHVTRPFSLDSEYFNWNVTELKVVSVGEEFRFLVLEFCCPCFTEFWDLGNCLSFGVRRTFLVLQICSVNCLLFSQHSVQLSYQKGLFLDVSPFSLSLLGVSLNFLSLLVGEYFHSFDSNFSSSILVRRPLGCWVLLLKLLVFLSEVQKMSDTGTRLYELSSGLGCADFSLPNLFYSIKFSGRLVPNKN